MSTPIETNTEELQEILQTVYNLPMAGGGGSAPDLVIALDTSDTMTISNNKDKVTFDSADVVKTYNKLLSGETVNCVLNAKYHQHSGAAFNASSPQLTVYAQSESNNSARVGFMIAMFKLWYDYNNHYGDILVELRFDIHGNGTATLRGIFANKSVAFTSALV